MLACNFRLMVAILTALEECLYLNSLGYRRFNFELVVLRCVALLSWTALQYFVLLLVLLGEPEAFGYLMRDVRMHLLHSVMINMHRLPVKVVINRRGRVRVAIHSVARDHVEELVVRLRALLHSNMAATARILIHSRVRLLTIRCLAVGYLGL